MTFQLKIFEPKSPITIPNEMQQMLDTNCKIIVAFSGGKDSVAMVLYLLDLGIDKSRIELHHHDVDGRGINLFDWACTPSYCKAFAKAFGLPIIFSWREGGILREIRRENEGLQDVYYEMGDTNIQLKSRKGNSTRKKFPAVSADLRTRWCSSVVKIDVLSRVINHSFKQGDLLVLTGERRQESTARSKYKEFEKYRSYTKSRNAWQWRPIIDFSENDVWSLMKKYQVQPHPCYELGWNRCSCQLCIFSSANTWASIYQLSPAKVEQIANLETEIDHTLYHKMTIWDKVNKGKSFIKPDKLNRWKDEILGEFTSPIFIENWQLPQGAYKTEASGSI
jgi:3'-phosphoadenosine 5'-phosphosulfate sulfotransferase (PAPS reductase)/FAD synthetase